MDRKRMPLVFLCRGSCKSCCHSYVRQKLLCSQSLFISMERPPVSPWPLLLHTYIFQSKTFFLSSTVFNNKINTIQILQFSIVSMHTGKGFIWSPKYYTQWKTTSPIYKWCTIVNITEDLPHECICLLYLIKLMTSKVGLKAMFSFQSCSQA